MKSNIIKNYLIISMILLIIFSILYYHGLNKNYVKTIPSIVHNDYIEPAMAYIPPGSFSMGIGGTERDEFPMHEVIIKHGFYIGIYEVTFNEYDMFCENTQREKPNDYGWGRGKRPVIDVSWYDAHAYTKWLSEKTGMHYKLPTEAQWEYAARASTTTVYSFGQSSEEIGDYVWYNKNTDRTQEVGLKKPNYFGLYDMFGNADEWCEDWYVDSYKDTSMDGEIPYLSNTGYKVKRGSAWVYGKFYFRSANRYFAKPDFKGMGEGFRLIREL